MSEPAWLGGRIDFPGPPFSARWNMANSVADAHLSDATGNASAAGVTVYNRFYLTLSNYFELPEGAYLDLMTLIATSTHEGSIVIHRCDPQGLVLGLRSDSAAYPYSCVPIARGVKHCIEAMWTADQGAQNDGVLQVWFNGAVLRLTNLDQGAITHVHYGVRNQGGVGKGWFKLDDIITDGGRLFPRQEHDGVKLFTKSGWAFVGPGTVEMVRLIGSSAENCNVQIYDTNRINYAEHDLVEQLWQTANAPKVLVSERPFQVRNGCYVKLSGGDPQAILRFRDAMSDFEYHGRPPAMDDGTME